MEFRNNEHIWVEKYRPRNLEDLIIPKSIKEDFRKYIEKGSIPNLLFTSTTPGLGKTSLVTALINELKAEKCWINGSKESGIDIARSKIVDFASTVSLLDSPKLVIVDESDGLNNNSQAALRGVIEEFSSNVSFIFTANYKDKLIEPLLNRMVCYNFDELFFNPDNKKDLAIEMYHRAEWILENEKISYKKEDIGALIKICYPSMRSVINALQAGSISGEFRLDTNLVESTEAFKEIMKFLAKKDFYSARNILNNVSDPGAFYTFLYNSAEDYLEDKDISKAVLILAKYQDFNSRARDRLVTLAACLVELMDLNYKG